MAVLYALAHQSSVFLVYSLQVMQVYWPFFYSTWLSSTVNAWLDYAGNVCCGRTHQLITRDNLRGKKGFRHLPEAATDFVLPFASHTLGTRTGTVFTTIYFLRYLRMDPISQSVGPWQAFTDQHKIMLQLIGPIYKLQRI